MAGIVAPDVFPFRDPRTMKQVVGRIVNPVGFMEIGGLDGPGKWFKAYGASEQSKQENTMKVEAPTKVKAAHSSANKSIE